MSHDKVLEIKTVQIAPFRTLMTALKDILLETNITFSPDGMRIINMDKSHTILAHLFLQAENFEYFYCKYPTQDNPQNIGQRIPLNLNKTQV